MNLHELDSYKLADAVKFHNRLNPRLWDKSEHLLPEVRNKLLEIAADFQEFLGVPDLDVVDITVSGSNAAYSYTPHSDIDLHLVVKQPEGADEVYQELFNAKKYQYNDMHDIRIHGADVELYVQPADESPVSLGEYSVRDGKWLQVPRRKRAKIDQSVVKHKYEDVKARIESALKDNDSDRIYALIKKIKEMRQAGLDAHGEFGPENLAFKMLRSQGYIERLYKAYADARDRELSLMEKKKRKKAKKKFTYGSYGGWFFPGYNFNAGETSDAGGGDGGGESIREADTGLAQGSVIGDTGAQSTWDGVDPDTDEYLSEDDVNQSVLRDFIRYAAGEIGLKKMPRIHIHNDPEWSEQERSFGRFEPETQDLHINMWDRHIMDVFRTTAHELAHARQHEIESLGPDAGETGSDMENEAHAVAGIIMRNWARKHPNMFESSGYIPTAAQAADPRFKMALTKDVRPGQTGREANKMALKTDSQGRPALLMKTANLIKEGLDKPTLNVEQLAKKHSVDIKQIKAQLAKGIGVELEHTSDRATAKEIALDHLAEFPDYYDRLERAEAKESILNDLRGEFALLEDEYISEVRMSTANLRQLAAKTGARAGMEFEMIVPEVGSIDVEPEYERDDDQDRRARSFDDVEEFFYDGDYNSRRDVQSLLNELGEAYQEWKMDRTANDWDNDGVDYLRDYIDVNDLFDRDEALEIARDEFADANPDIPLDSEEAQRGISARVDELQEQFVLDEFESQGRIYNDAFTEFADEKNQEYDESDFLEEAYPYMSDIERNFDIQWPYYYDINDGQSGDANVDEVADEFEEAIGRPVNASSSYHGATRQAGKYVVEPDGSLEGDDPGDAGLEFVSPPLPIDELLSDLNKVKEWAGRRGCYTNDSTGLHINISVPDYSLEKLDYVKLALLMGDEYVLELFGRSGNHYAKAATGKIRTALQKDPNLAPALLDKMRGHMEDLATKAIHSGITDKYTSINTKTGYIEFRSPGGDWLDANFDKIENTLLRFTVALSAAIDPQAYRQEYLKKLYKLLEGAQDKGSVDVVQLFSNYSAGELDKAALIRQVREKQLARNLAKGKTPPGQKYWWNVQWDANRRMEVVAGSKEVALQVAAEEWGVPESQLAGAKVTPLRPYQEPQAPNQTGNWGIWMQGPGRFARAPGQINNNVLRRFPSREAAEQWISQTRSTNSAMRTDIEVREIEPSATSQPQQGSGAYTYRVFTTDNNQTVGTFQSDGIQGSTNANIAFRNYLTSIGRDSAAGFNYEQIGRERQQPEFVDTTTQSSRGDLTPRGPGPWEIYRISDNSSVRELRNTSRPEAEQEARNALGLRGEAPELYGVRTRQQQPQPLGAGREFVGWKIVDPQGRTIHEFSGIGNAQADANAFAINWLRNNPRHMQAGVEVVPNWREA